MRGHTPLVAMRRAGLKPPAVFVDVDAGPHALPSWAQWHRWGSLPDIDIDATDSLLRIDWRWAVGLTVHVSGGSDERVRTVTRLLVEAGAARVISSLVERIGVDEEFPAFRCAWIEDTAGHMGPQPEEVSDGAHAAG